MIELIKYSLAVCMLLSPFANPYQPSMPLEGQKTASDTVLRPEDYLLTLDDLPPAFLEKYEDDDLQFAFPLQMKLPNYYRAVNELRIAHSKKGMGIKMSISIGVPEYWDDMAIGAYPAEMGASVNALEGNWETGVKMKISSWTLVRFVKGNILAELSYRGPIDDVVLLANALAEKLPSELPGPDTWQLELPPANRNVSLPNYYLFDFKIVHNDHTDILSLWDPYEHIAFRTRYPFSRFTEAIYDLQSGIYVQKMEVAPTVEDNPYFFAYGILGNDNDPILSPPFHPGKYEAHFWVGDVMILNYPFYYSAENYQ